MNLTGTVKLNGVTYRNFRYLKLKPPNMLIKSRESRFLFPTVTQHETAMTLMS